MFAHFVAGSTILQSVTLREALRQVHLSRRFLRIGPALFAVLARSFSRRHNLETFANNRCYPERGSICYFLWRVLTTNP